MRSWKNGAIQLRRELDRYVILAEGFREELPPEVFAQLTYFGLFESQLVFQLPRNWVIFDTKNDRVDIKPISAKLTLNDGSSSFEIEWRAKGCRVRHDLDVRFIPGDIRGFEVQQNIFSTLSSSFHNAPFELLNTKTPLIKISADPNARSAVVFLHGGPGQRFSRERNPVLESLVRIGYDICVPIYPGDPCAEAPRRPYGPVDTRWAEELRRVVLELPYQNLIIFAHSFGCWLGTRIAENLPLLTLNGVFDLATARELAPQTFAGLVDYHPTRGPTRWTHISSKFDHVVPTDKTLASFERFRSRPKRYLNIQTEEHEITRKKWVSRIIKEIDRLRGLNPKTGTYV